MSTMIWFVGFGLMMASFMFLFGGRRDEPEQPRISVEPWWPESEPRQR